MDAVIAAGSVIVRGATPMFWASAIIIGITIVAVTVLLEKVIFKSETISTTRKTCIRG